MLNIFKAILLAAIMSFVIAGIGNHSKEVSDGFVDQNVEQINSVDSKSVISRRVGTLPK